MNETAILHTTDKCASSEEASFGQDVFGRRRVSGVRDARKTYDVILSSLQPNSPSRSCNGAPPAENLYDIQISLLLYTCLYEISMRQTVWDHDTTSDLDVRPT